MGWASIYIQELREGKTVRFRPSGDAMSGKIESRQLVTLEPLGETSPRARDIVLCTVRGRQYLHLVKAVRGGQFQIGNNRGGINGWVTRKSVHGICTKIEP